MLDSRKREIRIKADYFRANCKIGRYGIINLFKECERMGYKLVRYPLGENADLGFMMKKDNDIVIFTNSCSRLSREIFTLAHEVGHVILHLNDENTFIDDSVTINGRSTDEKEQEANYFAACLLMPSDDVHRFIDLEIKNFQECGLSAMDIARIMSEFNVSFDMALNRLESLGVINTDQKMRLDNIKTEMKVGNLLRAVGVVIDPDCGFYHETEAPIILDDTTNKFEKGRPKIRVYTSVDSRFILEDFIAKLEVLYGKGSDTK